MQSSTRVDVVGLLTVVAGLVSAAGSARADNWGLSIRGGEARSVEVPVVARIAESVDAGSYAIVSSDGKTLTHAQVFNDGGQRWLGLVLPAGKTSPEGTYELKPAATAADENEGVTFAPAGPNLSISVGREPFSVYRVDEG